MKRSVMVSVVVLVASLFVGSALKAQAATSPAVSAAQSVDDASAGGGYWAAWSEAASH